MADERKRKMIGRVHSDKMDKTIVVEVRRRVREARYQKIVTTRKRYFAHDENNECKIGDLVEIKESKPMSLNKRWTLIRVVERSVEVAS